MKKQTTILVASTVAILAFSAWLAIWLVPRHKEITPVAHIATSKKVQSPNEPADVSIEAMIEKITMLFEQNVQGKLNPENYGEEIGLRIFNVTNHVERTALARRYSDVLMSMPLAAGTYYDRLNRLDHIVRMVENWDGILYQIQFDPKIRIKLWLTLLGNFRDAAESGWKADASVIQAQFVETNAIQRLDRTPPDKKLCVGGYRGRLVGPYAVSRFMPKGRRKDFVRFAMIELRNLVHLYNLFVPRIITYLPPREQARTEKELEETVRKLEIEKLLEAMEKDVKR